LSKEITTIKSQKAEDRIEKDDLRYLKKFANLLDSQFRIPGTDITFGIDPIIGMIPIVGDIVGYGFSAVMIFTALKKGVKGEILVKMLGNIAIDALVGLVPVLGTLFDFVYKANDRNYQLITEFVEEDKHSGSAWPYVLAFVGITLFVIIAVVWLAISLITWVISWFN